MMKWLEQFFKKEVIPEPEPIVEEKMECEPEPERECYTRSDMFLFSGYLIGKKQGDPGLSVTEIFEEWKERFKSNQDG